MEELKPIVKNLFTDYLDNKKDSSVPDDKRIKDFVVHDIEIFRNENNTLFLTNYDELPATKDFVIAGSGVLDESGWVKHRNIFVNIEKVNGEYQIKNLSSGP